MSNEAVVIVGDFSAGERRWAAVGVGTSLDEAIGFAVQSCPPDADWQLVRWRHLYGE